MRNYKAKNVDAYIESSVSGARSNLEELRNIIRSCVPNAQEGISWGVPFYKYHGVLAGFSAFTKHVSFGFADVLSFDDRKRLEKLGYKTGSKTVQIRFDQKVPKTEIEKIVKAKAKMNENKYAIK